MIEFMVPVVSEFRSILTNSDLFMALPQKKGPVVSRAGVVILPTPGIRSAVRSRSTSSR